MGVRIHGLQKLLGKVYYKMACLGIDETANWTNAKNMFDDVYEAHIFDLEPKFGDLFGDYVTGSKEAIFQLNFTTSSTVCFNRASNRFAPPQATTGISWELIKRLKLLMIYMKVLIREILELMRHF